MIFHELAIMLGYTVNEIREKMTSRELRSWVRYFEVRPPGWRDDLRTGYVMQSMGAKVKPFEIFPSLAAIKKYQEEDDRIRLQNAIKNPFIQKLRHIAAERGHNILEKPDASKNTGLGDQPNPSSSRKGG